MIVLIESPSHKDGRLRQAAGVLCRLEANALRRSATRLAATSVSKTRAMRNAMFFSAMSIPHPTPRRC
jgi:hypothetical protein